jgi:hypothetical protein
MAVVTLAESRLAIYTVTECGGRRECRPRVPENAGMLSRVIAADCFLLRETTLHAYSSYLDAELEGNGAVGSAQTDPP